MVRVCLLVPLMVRALDWTGEGRLTRVLLRYSSRESELYFIALNKE